MRPSNADIYILSLHDALPISEPRREIGGDRFGHLHLGQVALLLVALDRLDLPEMEMPEADRKSTRLNSSHEWSSYAHFCLKKKRLRSGEDFFCYHLKGGTGCR